MPPARRSFNTVLDKAIEAGNPAVLAAVLTPQGVWAGAAGIDGPAGRKATPDDVWAIASISKTFTAALVFKLAEAGKVDLDKPLSNYLGAVKANTNGATVRQALAMRSGFPTPRTPSSRWSTLHHNGSGLLRRSSRPSPQPSPRQVPSTTTRTPPTSCSTWPPSRSPGRHWPRRCVPKCSTQRIHPMSLLVQTCCRRHRSRGPCRSRPTPRRRAVRDGRGAPFGLRRDVLAGGSRDGRRCAEPRVVGVAALRREGRHQGLAGHHGAGGSQTDTDSGSTSSPTSERTVAFGYTGSKSGYESLLVVFPERQEVVVVGVTQRDADVTKIAADLLNASSG